MRVRVGKRERERERERIEREETDTQRRETRKERATQAVAHLALCCCLIVRPVSWGARAQAQGIADDARPTLQLRWTCHSARHHHCARCRYCCCRRHGSTLDQRPGTRSHIGVSTLNSFRSDWFCSASGRCKLPKMRVNVIRPTFHIHRCTFHCCFLNDATQAARFRPVEVNSDSIGVAGTAV